jgi:hypothetical protein
MCPAQFGTHCVPIWEALKESAHIPEVTLIKTLSEFPSELIGQIGQQALAVISPSLPALLKLDDMPADLPVGLNLDGIDGPQSPCPCISDQAPQGIEQGGSRFRTVQPVTSLLEEIEMCPEDGLGIFETWPGTQTNGNSPSRASLMAWVRVRTEKMCMKFKVYFLAN